MTVSTRRRESPETRQQVGGESWKVFHAPWPSTMVGRRQAVVRALASKGGKIEQERRKVIVIGNNITPIRSGVQNILTRRIRETNIVVSFTKSKKRKPISRSLFTKLPMLTLLGSSSALPLNLS